MHSPEDVFIWFVWVLKYKNLMCFNGFCVIGLIIYLYLYLYFVFLTFLWVLQNCVCEIGAYTNWMNQWIDILINEWMLGQSLEALGWQLLYKISSNFWMTNSCLANRSHSDYDPTKSIKPRIHQSNSLYLSALANHCCFYHFCTLSLNYLVFFKLLCSLFLRISLIPYNPYFFGCPVRLIHSSNIVIWFGLPIWANQANVFFSNGYSLSNSLLI